MAPPGSPRRVGENHVVTSRHCTHEVHLDCVDKIIVNLHISAVCMCVCVCVRAITVRGRDLRGAAGRGRAGLWDAMLMDDC